MPILPPSYKFSGDTNKSISYKAQALQYYNLIASNIKLNGVGFINRAYTLLDKTKIDIVVKSESNYDIVSGDIHISTVVSPTSTTINPFYMESGFLFSGSTFINNEKTYLPAIIKFSNFVLGKITTLIDPSIKKSLNDGDDSLALGCIDSKKVSELSVVDSLGNVTVFSNSNKIYCQDLYLRKKTQASVPASVFSGKLRLFIQSIYGSKRTDYTIDYGSLLDYPYLLLRDIKIDSGLNTSGLFKDSKDNYWLITMGSHIFARKLTPDKETSTYFKDKIKDDPLNEAYILSTLTPSKEEYLIGQQSLTDNYLPIAYGWKFNSDGSRCSIVVNTQAYGSYNNSAIFSKLITAYFDINKETGLPYLYNIEEISSGYHIPFNQSKIFVPLYALNIMRAITAAGSLSIVTSNLSAPIYCYYSKDDLQIITAKNGAQTSFVDIWNYSGNTDFFSPPTLVQDSINKVYGFNGGSTIATKAAGFTINGDSSFNKSSEEHPTGVTTSVRWLVLNPIPVESNGPIEPDGTRARYFYSVENGLTPSYYFSSYTYSSKQFSSVLVIPFSDCESVSLAGRTRKQNILSSQDIRAFGNNIGYRTDYWNWHGGLLVWDSFSNTKYKTIGETGAIETWGTFSGFSPEDPSIEYFGLQEGISFTDTSKLYTSSSAYTVPVLPGSLDGIFSVTLSDPFFYSPLSTYSSYSGSTSSATLGSPFNHDWPTLSSGGPVSSVGWA